MTVRDSLFSSSSASSSASVTQDEPHGRSPVARWSTLTDPARPDEHPRSSLRAILVFSSILVPVAAIPYVLVRRHYVNLRKEVTSLRAANASLTREVRGAFADLSKQQADLNQAEELFERMRCR